MSDCIFCKIASGEIPSSVFYEDELVVAFDDLSPQAPVHSLIIPREHYAHVGDDVPGDVAAAMLAAVPIVAVMKGVADSGYRIIANTGADAAQTVPHFHIHLLGGTPLGEGMLP